jgi:pyrroloquinoline quinone biosynthesis protein B
MLRAIVLGSAAGGGFPQWNSALPGCLRARAGDVRAKPRTQASLAVSADGETWAVVNASPDLRQQIAATPALHPRARRGARNSPIAAVVLTGAEVDTVMGLLHLREGHAFTVWGAPQSLEVLGANPIFRALNPEIVGRVSLPFGEPAEILPGLLAEAYPVPGKVPLFAEDAGGTDPGRADDGEAIGLRLSAQVSAEALHYIPGCAAMTPELAERLRGAACALFDGTLFEDDEMIRAKAGPKTGRRMGHMPVTETLAAFAPLGVRRKILTHVNNSNPVLLDDSPERAHIRTRGWEVAEDGMEIALP